MKKVLFFPLLFFILSIFLLGYAYFLGEVHIGLIMIFPLITTNGLFGLLGVIFLILSFFTFFLLFPRIIIPTKENQFNNELSSFKIDKKEDRKVHAGGVIFLGPIPIIFGTDKKITTLMILTSIIILILIILYASLLLNE